MALYPKPETKPVNPCFSSGPCAKRPGWSAETALANVLTGRSHRAKVAVARLNEVIERSRDLLDLPEGYELAIVPGSDTGAMEMALWNLLGPKGVDVVGWEVFGKIWIGDILQQLKLEDVRKFEPAVFGELPDLSQLDTDRDVVFTWNGTTAGAAIPNGDWIKQDRKGLTICDATSAIFAMDIPVDKLDVITWSWQKVLGSEAAHGMIALSPRAIERLESYTPTWPIPKILRLTKGGKLNMDPFIGKTINTPSMLAVEDCIDALKWAESVGGLNGMIDRSRQNLEVIADWVEKSDWIDFLVKDPAARASTSITLEINDPWFLDQPEDKLWPFIKDVVTLVENEGAGYDFANHRDAVPGFRIWGGSTVEAADIQTLLPWLDWAYQQVKQNYQAKAA
ncbi:MAG: phosphoserine transaminase [Pseudomonadota bacterium]